MNIIKVNYNWKKKALANIPRLWTRNLGKEKFFFPLSVRIEGTESITLIQIGLIILVAIRLAVFQLPFKANVRRVIYSNYKTSDCVVDRYCQGFQSKVVLLSLLIGYGLSIDHELRFAELKIWLFMHLIS